MIKPLIALLFLAPLTTMATTTDDYFELTYFAKSTHLISGDYNEDHNVLGLEYRNDYRGYGVAVFKNSHYDQSVAIDYARYWHPSDYIETSVRLGLVTGYDDTPVLLAASVAYTKYDIFIPKVSWFGNAIIFSLSFKF